MIERVARAIYEAAPISRIYDDDDGNPMAWGDAPDNVKSACFEQARAAIAAMLNPTDAMIEAGVSRHSATIADEWRAMVAAALRE